MPNNKRSRVRSQDLSAIRAHFDKVKFTINRNAQNYETRRNAECSLAAELHSWLPLRLDTIPGRYYDAQYYRRWRRNFDCTVTLGARIILLDPGEHTLETIVIYNTDRSNPGAYHFAVAFVGNILDMTGYEYHVSELEIALDTTCERTGLWLAQHALPSWSRLGSHFNYETDAYREGGSSNGHSEYMFRGRPLYEIREDGIRGELLRIPRRQFVAYEKKDGIWRYELRFFRQYLGPRRVNTVADIFLAAPCLISGNLSFRELKTKKLRKELPSSRNWRLTHKSIAEKMAIITHRQRWTRAQTERYFKRLPAPEIDMAPFQSDEDGNTYFPENNALHAII